MNINILFPIFQLIILNFMYKKVICLLIFRYFKMQRFAESFKEPF